LRHYEFLFILKPTLDNEEMRARIESMNEIITKNDGIVAKCDELGIKSLAYEIAKNKRGYYVVTYFQAPAVAIKEIERIARINEDLIRFLTTKFEKKKEIAQWEKLAKAASEKKEEKPAPKAEPKQFNKRC